MHDDRTPTTPRRTAALLAAIALLVASCGGGSDPTTTDFVPPTSEVIFEPPTTTTRPPAPLDSVFIDDLDLTVDIPRDWEYRIEDLRFGRASAAFRADNSAGALLVIGVGSEIVGDLGEFVGLDARAVLITVELSSLLDIAPAVVEDEPATLGDQVDSQVPTTIGGRDGYRVEMFVTQTDGSTATIVALIADDGADDATVVAFLYEDDLPADRIAQGMDALASIRFE